MYFLIANLCSLKFIFVEKTRYQHLFFDLDRTLWDMDTNSKLTLQEILSEVGLALDFNHFYSTYTSINDALWQLYRLNKIDKEQLRYQRFTKSLEVFKIEDKELSIKMGDLYVERSPLKTGLLPNTVEVLSQLKESYNLHIITNGFEEVQLLKLRNSGIEAFFENVITSESAGCKKPSPGIFTYALSLTGANRKNALMIGDSLVMDIQGAKKVGIDQVFFNPKKEKHSQKVTFEIADLLELKRFLV